MKKLFVFIMMFTLVFSSIINSFALTPDLENDIKIQLINNDVMYIENDEAISIDVNEVKNIELTMAALNNSTNDEFIKNAFQNGTRVFIKDSEISRNEVRRYFGLEEKDYTLVSRNEEEVDDGNDAINVDVSLLEQTGLMIYKEDEIINITLLRVENYKNDNVVSNAIDGVFVKDYIGLTTEDMTIEGISTDSMIAEGVMTTETFSLEWNSVDIDTSTYIVARGEFDTSLNLYSYVNNPNPNDQYISYVPYIADIQMNTGWYIDKTELEIMGHDSSLIAGYGPLNTSSNTASVSFGLPYSVSVTIDMGTTVDIDKIAGGINSRNFKVRYNAETSLGINAVSTYMNAQAHIESYQTNSSLEGYGYFKVYTVGYQFSSPINYYNSTADFVD